MDTPHLEGPAYQNPEQAARHVWQKCTALAAAPAEASGVSRKGGIIFVTMTGLPRMAVTQERIRRAVRQAFGMNGESAAGANPHPAHNIVIDVVDNHIRLYLTPR